MMPPVLGIVSIKTGKGTRRIHIPLPLVLLWPLVLLVYSVLFSMFPLLRKEQREQGAWAIAKISTDAFLHLSGLEVDVESGSGHVRVKIL